MRIALCAIAFAVLAGQFLCPAAGAQDYPSRPIKIVVPYPAGGPSDTAARILADPLARELGQPIIIENRTGGAGMIGTEAVIRGAHDGYTLLVGGLATLVLLPAAKPSEYDPLKHVVPLTQIWYSPQVLAVRSTLGFKSPADLISHAKANPGKLTFGSAGTGTVTHLAILLLAQQAGIDITHVPYRSTALWLHDAIAGRIDAGFGDVKTLLPLIEAKSVVPLAVTVPTRTPQLPDVPTVKEAGFPEFETENWFGLLALGQTPPMILERLKSAVVRAQSDPAYIAALAKVGGMAGKSGPVALNSVIENDVRRFSPLIRSLAGKIE